MEATGRLKYFIGSAEAIEKTTPFSSWASIISQFMMFEEPEISEYVKKKCGEKWVDYLPLLSIVNVKMEIKDNPSTFVMSPKQKYNCLMELLLKIFKTKSIEKPFMLIFENLQWMVIILSFFIFLFLFFYFDINRINGPSNLQYPF